MNLLSVPKLDPSNGRWRDCTELTVPRNPTVWGGCVGKKCKNCLDFIRHPNWIAWFWAENAWTKCRKGFLLGKWQDDKMTGFPCDFHKPYYLRRLFANWKILTTWWFQPIWKIWSSNWIISPNRGENKKYLSCHHPAYDFSKVKFPLLNYSHLFGVFGLCDVTLSSHTRTIKCSQRVCPWKSAKIAPKKRKRDTSFITTIFSGAKTRLLVFKGGYIIL